MEIGYSETFLDKKKIQLPKVIVNHPVLVNNVLLKYTHFSIFFSLDRKLPIYSAVNIDGKNKYSITRRKSSESWKIEAQIDQDCQIGKSFYSNTGRYFHRGHIVRRLDPVWGGESEAIAAEKDTFHYTNACPQHKDFNPTIWLELERNILEKGAVAQGEKIIVFAGPVISPADKPYLEQINNKIILIPSCFWKIVLWKRNDGRISAVGFMQSQELLIAKLVDQGFGGKRIRGSLDNHFEGMKFKDNSVYQVNIDNITKVTGLTFDFGDFFLPIVPTETGSTILKSQFVAEENVKRRFRGDYKSQISIDGLILY